MDDTKIGRINHLARKAREEGLSEDERLEQHKLRREYVDAVKNSLRGCIEQIKLVD